jgi:hypothetical protein
MWGKKHSDKKTIRKVSNKHINQFTERENNKLHVGLGIQVEVYLQE